LGGEEKDGAVLEKPPGAQVHLEALEANDVSARLVRQVAPWFRW
jgi:hypothetical protein